MGLICGPPMQTPIISSFHSFLLLHVQHLHDFAPSNAGQMEVQNSGILTWPWNSPSKQPPGGHICFKNSIISVISSSVSFFHVWPCQYFFFLIFYLIVDILQVISELLNHETIFIVKILNG